MAAGSDGASPSRRLGDFVPRGPARASRALGAAGLDLLVVTTITMLLWPFPFIRLTLGIPVAVHVALVVVAILVLDAVYLTAAAAAWGRTLAMYLLDLGLAGRARPFGMATSARWALGTTAATVPALLGLHRAMDPEAGWAARLSGLRTVTTKAPAS